MKVKVVTVVLLLLFMAGMVGAQYTSEALTLTVYSDGYVKVDQYIKPDNYVVSVTVPLLAKDVTGLAVIDDRGNPLPYELNGSKVAVYFENATRVHLRYYTPDLTSKEGAIWTLKISWDEPIKIIFPKNAVIVDLSDVPLEISGDIITMPPGNQSISYVIKYPSPSPTETTTSTTVTSPPSTTTTHNNGTMIPSPSSPNPTPSSGINWTPILMGIVVVAGLALGFTYHKRSRARGEEVSSGGMKREEFEKYLEKFDLNEEEKGALLYIFERGGKAKQAEVRDALGIPKTTAWRMFQRLEKQGLVRVYKKRRENWVELKL